MSSITTQSLLRQFTRAWETYDQEATAQQRIAHTALGLLQDYLQQHPLLPHRALEIGCGTGYFTHLVQPLFPMAQWTLNDLVPNAQRLLPTCLPGTQFVGGDILSCPLASDYDLVVSTSVFQWITARETLVRRLAEGQPRGGILFFSTFLPGNLCEIKELTGIGLAYPTPDEWRETLSPWYEVEVVHHESQTLWFRTPLEVLQHLRHTGVTATHTTPWTPHRLHEFCRAYVAQYGNPQGEVPLTYRPLYLGARRR